jgi:anti-sigma regulatory factor (Ser/Thr protein kinase)
MNYRIEVLADNASIARLIAFSDEVERHLPLTFDQSYLLRLAIEEIATNVIKYGYERGAPGPIQVRCSYDDGRLRLVIRDRGRPFDPRQSPEPELGGDLESRAVGGLGVFLVREMADDVQYRRDAAGGWNELVVVKGRGSGDV